MNIFINPNQTKYRFAEGSYLFIFSDYQSDIQISISDKQNSNIVFILFNSTVAINVGQQSQSNSSINSITSGSQSHITFQSKISGNNSSSTSHHYIFSQDHSEISFDGSMTLGKDINDSAGYLYEHGIILGSHIKISTKPNLDVHSSNIKAGHGATLQKFDAKELFYPMSRGLSLQQAKNLLIEGIITKSISILGENPELHPLIYQLSELISGQTTTPTSRSHLLSVLGTSQNNSVND